MLPFVAWKRGKYFEKVNKDFTSQECPVCRLYTGKKLLQQRIHKCQYCNTFLPRDVASAKVIEQRGRIALFQPVSNQMAWHRRGAGVLQLTLFDLVTAE
ncbi:MAG: zinc ribbon domain-containing protein [Xenococcaceae cyanobacterium MO_167.B27]|nr:zinc ribbon domain-containing protein [Xenococcaceae cyanobacterium MO_167.B27]